MNAPKISAYRVLKSHQSDDLETQVNQLLKKGWQLFGSLQVVCPLVDESPAPAFYQAMVSGDPVRMSWEGFCETAPDSAPPVA